MRKTFLLIFLTLISFCILSSKDYRRIVSLAPSITKSIYSLGAEDKLIGCTSYCKEAKGKNKTVVASVIKINTELLVSLKPDLVIVSDFTKDKDVNTIKKFGIEVKKMKTPHSFDEICRQFKELGQWLGRTKEAETIVNDSRKKVGAVIEATKKDRNVSVFFQIGADPVYAVTPDMFMNDYVKFINGNNIASSLKKGRIGREFVLKGNPDYIFITTMGMIGKREEQEWRKFEGIKAVKNNRIYIIDSDIACVPTPFTFAEALEQIYKFIKNGKQ